MIWRVLRIAGPALIVLLVLAWFVSAHAQPYVIRSCEHAYAKKPTCGFGIETYPTLKACRADVATIERNLPEMTLTCVERGVVI